MILANALVYSFIICCVVSAALQIIAWSRHGREDVRVSAKALWRPEGYFDEIGIRQMQVARSLLLIGGFAYVAYGALVVALNVLSAR